MRIHENGFSFFGGAQRGNAAAGQALSVILQRFSNNKPYATLASVPISFRPGLLSVSDSVDLPITLTKEWD